MRKSIIDILNKSNLNLVEEYHKLYEMFCYDEMCYHGNHHYSLSKIFEVFIKEWKYRGTRLCIEDVFEDLNLGDETTKTNPLEDILNLIDLIFNIYSFTKYLSSSGYEIYFDRDSFLLENSSYILNKLGYSIVEKEGYDVVLLKKHADATSTALMLDEKENDISELILNYNDFRIEKNIDEKRKILIDLGNYLEPERKKLKSVNPGLEDAIFFSLNNLNIRHNNKTGKSKTPKLEKIDDTKLIEYYDNTYDMILIAIRLLKLKDIKKIIDELKQD